MQWLILTNKNLTYFPFLWLNSPLKLAIRSASFAKFASPSWAFKARTCAKYFLILPNSFCLPFNVCQLSMVNLVHTFFPLLRNFLMRGENVCTKLTFLFLIIKTFLTTHLLTFFFILFFFFSHPDSDLTFKRSNIQVFCFLFISIIFWTTNNFIDNRLLIKGKQPTKNYLNKQSFINEDVCRISFNKTFQ